MKKLLFFSALAAMTLVACQSYDTELAMPDDEAALTAVQKEEITQITEDVNSGEVKNILGSLFGKQRKGRSADYTVSLLKDKHGVDRVICINYVDNGGFALISAEKTHSPILAYAEEGNFTVTDSLPFPLSEWMDCTMHSIAESESLPADSLETIARKWHRYEVIKPLTISDLIQSRSISPDESVELFHKMKPYLDQWAAQGYRVYSIDQYTSGLSFGDLSQLIGYVQANIFPTYYDEYSNITVVVEKDFSSTTGKGQCFKTKWDQLQGFNQSFPETTDNYTGHIPAGCTPVAVGQILYANKYPNYFNWAGMSLAPYGNKLTSDFLLDIYTKCKSHYEPSSGGTATNFNDVPNALKAFGYTCKKIGASDIKFDVLENNTPVLMSSEFENGNGHTWIIEGAKRMNMYTEVEVWSFRYPEEFSCFHKETINNTSDLAFYANWGWGGKYDSYCSFDHFLPANHTQYRLKQAIINIRHN